MSRQFISSVDAQDPSQLPETGRIEGGVSGLAVYQNRQQEHAYFYLPLTIIPQQQADGRPMVNLIAMGDGGYLNFNIRWRASDEQMVALRGYLATMLELDHPDTLMLAFAPVKSVKFDLFLMQDTDADSVLLGQAGSTGSPPYSSLFNIKLTSQQFAQAEKVLAGQSGLFGLRLESEWYEDVFLQGTLKGDLDLQPVLVIDQPGTAWLLDYLISQIESGGLILSIDTALEQGAPAYEEFKQEVLNQAVEVVSMALMSDQTLPRLSLSVEYQQTTGVPRPVLLITDMADWFDPAT